MYKVDRINGQEREDDVFAGKNPKKVEFYDDFTTTNINNYSNLSGSSATIALENGDLKLTKATAGYSVAVSDRNRTSKNHISILDLKSLTVDLTNYNGLISRFVDANNYIGAYFQGAYLKLRKRISGSSTDLVNVLISGFNTSHEYTLVHKIYNTLTAAFLINKTTNGIVAKGIGIDSTIELASTSNAIIGGGLAEGNYFDNYKTIKLTDEGFVNVIVIGDSLSAYAPEGGELYTDILNRLLLDKPIIVNNKAVSGRDIAAVYAGLAADVIANKVVGAKNIVICLAGTNDSDDADEDALFAGLNNIYTECIKNGFEVWAVTVPPRNDQSSTHATNIKNLNALIRNSARSAVTSRPEYILDLWNVIVDPSDDTKGLAEYFYTDNLHFVLAGRTALANLVLPQLKNVFSKVSAGNISTGSISSDISKSRNFVFNNCVDTDSDTDDVFLTGIPAGNGFLAVAETTGNVVAIYRMENTTLTAVSANAAFNTAKDNASTFNVYYETNQFKVQNKVGNNKYISVGLITFS